MMKYGCLYRQQVFLILNDDTNVLQVQVQVILISWFGACVVARQQQNKAKCNNFKS